MVNQAITQLVNYGVDKGLIEAEDRIFARNQLLLLMKQDSYEEPEQCPDIQSAEDLEAVLDILCKEAVKRSIIASDSVVLRDLFDTQLMSVLVPRPSQVIGTFHRIYQEASPEAATDYFYTLSKASDYIREYRIRRDEKWTADSAYGTLDVTINLSKPEKDPKMIALAKTMPASAYPKCQLCMENEGYAGRIDYPARENHRIIPLTLAGEQWGFQYSPYVYYNEHCIVFNGSHVPMVINRNTFEKMFAFLQQFPHYFIGSNADLPIVGGSILSHEHFQGGRYEFAMERAEVDHVFTVEGYEDIQAGIVKWPMSVIRLRSRNLSRMLDLAEHILKKWQGYTDADAFIFAETEGQPHNTITPIGRMREGDYELDLVLRNNITTEEHPLGVYHPHKELHHIKKENIGLIEVMGLAVLPARLKGEMQQLAEAILTGKDLSAEEATAKHEAWVTEFLPKYEGQLSQETVMDILKKEIGNVFVRVLEDAGVFSCTEQGRAAFLRFIQSL